MKTIISRLYYSPIKALFFLASSSLHQRSSAKDGSIVVGQLGDTNLNTTLEDEAEMLLERLARRVEQHITGLHGTTKQEDSLRAAESHRIGHGDTQQITRLFEYLDG